MTFAPEEKLAEAPPNEEWLKKQQQQFIHVAMANYKGQLQYIALDRMGTVWWFNHAQRCWFQFEMEKKEGHP